MKKNPQKKSQKKPEKTGAKHPKKSPQKPRKPGFFGKYTLLFGLCLGAAGISAGVVSGTWLPVPLALCLVGAALALVWIFLFAIPTRQTWNPRALETNANALVAVLSVLAILGVVNFFGARYAQEFDLTEAKRFTLAPQTRAVVQNLPEPLKIWLFSDLADPATNELLDNYKRLSQKRFSYEYVNPLLQPGLARAFEIRDLGDAYLEMGDRRKLLLNLRSERLTEAKLTSGIESLLREKPIKVYFLQGHEEKSLDSEEGRGLSLVVEMLREKNYEVQPLNLAGKTPVPPDAGVVVLAGPQQPLFPEEVAALQNFLRAGGGVVLMLDPETDPGLESLLQEWGVGLDDRLAIDTGQLIGDLGPAAPVVSQYGDHPITRELGNNYTFFVLARPLLLQSREGIQEVPLAFTSENSWAEKNLSEAPAWEFNEKDDRKGPLILAAALSRFGKAEEGKEAPESRLVIFGDSDFAAGGFARNSLNSDLFLNAVGWAGQENEELLSIRPRETLDRRLKYTPQQVRLLWWLPLAVLPAIAFVGAAVLWFARR